MKKFFGEFKEFAMKGNVIDLAVGVIIGAAFGKIVTSVVNDIIMPTLGIFTGSVSFASLSVQVGAAQIKYGSFLQTIIDFILIALSIFLFVKLINNAKKKLETIAKKEQEAIDEAAVVVQSEEVALLSEIRDLLKEKK